MEAELEQLLETPEFQDVNYCNVIKTKNYGVVGTYRFMFTFAIVVGITKDGCYNRRYCYKSFEELVKGYVVLLTQDEMESPPVHIADPYWIKCKGEINIANPNNPNISHFDR